MMMTPQYPNSKTEASSSDVFPRLYIYIYTYINRNEKIQFFGVIIDLFQVYDNPLQMVKEDTVKYYYLFSPSEEGHHRPEINL